MISKVSAILTFTLRLILSSLFVFHVLSLFFCHFSNLILFIPFFSFSSHIKGYPKCISDPSADFSRLFKDKLFLVIDEFIQTVMNEKHVPS